MSPSGFTKDVQSLRPTAARAEQRSFEADLNEVQSLRQAKASSPDRPAINLLIFFVTFNSYVKCTETIEGTPTRPNPLSQHFIILMHS